MTRQTRQARWQQRKLAEGCCLQCGKKREEECRDLVLCAKCRRLAAERYALRRASSIAKQTKG
jgi:hypothetical protein